MIFDWGKHELTVEGRPLPILQFDSNRFDFLRLDTGELQNEARRYDTETEELCVFVCDDAGLYVIVDDKALERTETIPCGWRDRETGEMVSADVVRDYVLTAPGAVAPQL